MQRTFITSVVMAIVLGFANHTHAALLTRGTDTLGNRLIYDSDLGITWYDYTAPNWSTWDAHMAWASALTVNLGGTIYDDWRLPTIKIQEIPTVHAYDGSTSYGFNITSSEMGYLFHTELGNKGYYDTSGNYPQPDWGLANTGAFQHLRAALYYTDMTYPENPWSASHFDFSTGEQYVSAKLALGGTNLYAIAVRSGDVSAVPAPSTLLLLGAGLAGFSGVRRKFKKHDAKGGRE